MHVTILGRRYEFVWCRRKDIKRSHGECDHPTTPRKQIRIATDQSEFDVLDTILHEAAHAADFTKNEEWVLQFGTDVARLLWRLGYRRIEKGD